MAWHTKRMRTHLALCKKYLQYAKSNGIHNEISRNVGIVAANPVIRTLTKDQKAKIDLLLAKACYVDARPFGLYELHAFKAVMKLLHRAYTPPSRNTISG